MNNTFSNKRREYGELSLDEKKVSLNPVKQFKTWLQDAEEKEQQDATAMVLSTIDPYGEPDSRVVLLKEIDHGQFLFYTNYESPKAKQLEGHPCVALNFYWPILARQVRIKGEVSKISEKQSDNYFASRPFFSQVSACAAVQSTKIPHRKYLEEQFNTLANFYENKVVPRPAYWGGYAVVPHYFEFWQGRDNRLHDRIAYIKEQDQWLIYRLAP